MTYKSMQFGDGIMSMIDCRVTIDRKADPKGDRVLLTFEYVYTFLTKFARKSNAPHLPFSGKFLPYITW